MSTLKIALCNEVLGHLSFENQCKIAAALGYDALEVAPFTLAPDPMHIMDTQAMAFAQVAKDHGLRVSGLHWLLVAPSGLSIATPDGALRQRTVDVMCRLVELCQLMGGSYLVHGSPKQRSILPGETRESTLVRVRDCLSRAAMAAQANHVTYCIEPLSHRETDILNTVSQAVQVVNDINNPALKTMIDCSAAGQTESESVDSLMARWMPSGHIAHVQVNDPNRRGPGQGNLRFKPILDTLIHMQHEGHYDGLIAVEPFDYVPDGMGSAASSIGYLRGIIQTLENSNGSSAQIQNL